MLDRLIVFFAALIFVVACAATGGEAPPQGSGTGPAEPASLSDDYRLGPKTKSK